MKALILLALVLIVNLSGQKPAASIQSDKPFSSNGIIKIEPADSLAGIEMPATKRETGTLNGVAYRIYYSDGSGIFAGKSGASIDDPAHWKSHWHISCAKDAMTDQVLCHMYRRDLWVFVTAEGKATVSIGSDHYPGSNVMLRIDRAAPVSIGTRMLKGSFSFQDSKKLIEQISHAKTLTTRYQRWPEGYDRDDVWEEIYGFNEALQYLKWAVGHIK